MADARAQLVRAAACRVVPALRQAGARRIVEGNHRAELRPHARRARGAGALSPRDVRAAGDRRGVPPRRRVHLRRARQRRDGARCCRSSAMNFGSLPDRRASDLRLRGEVDLGHARGAARDLRVPGADRRRAAAPRSKTSCSAPTACSAAATGRASTSASTPTGVPNIVEVNPLPGILPNPADNSCLPKAARAAGMSYDELIQSALAARRRAA